MTPVSIIAAAVGDGRLACVLLCCRWHGSLHASSQGSLPEWFAGQQNSAKLCRPASVVHARLTLACAGHTHLRRSPQRGAVQQRWQRVHGSEQRWEVLKEMVDEEAKVGSLGWLLFCLAYGVVCRSQLSVVA